MVAQLKNKEQYEKARAIQAMFRGMAKESVEYYNEKTQKVEINICLQNKEGRVISILIELDDKDQVDVEFKIDCPEEDFIIAKKYIENIPKEEFENRGWPSGMGDFYVRVSGGVIYWGLNVSVRYRNTRNQEKLAMLFKDVLEVIGEYFYIGANKYVS